jgi:hypothetical protein
MYAEVNMRPITQNRSAPIRKAALWVSIALTSALSLWCLLVPYWHIHDAANRSHIVRSERRAIWKQDNAGASIDVVFTLVPVAAFAIVAVVLAFSLREGVETTPTAANTEDEAILRR